MSWALKQGAGGFGYTANMSVRYLRPVKLGSSYTAVGSVIKQEGRKVHTRARIMDESGKICVDVKALFVIPEKT
jgi:acyl-coenzyme A thioesterase PaaI-like protein